MAVYTPKLPTVNALYYSGDIADEDSAEFLQFLRHNCESYRINNRTGVVEFTLYQRLQHNNNPNSYSYVVKSDTYVTFTRPFDDLKFMPRREFTDTYSPVLKS